MCVCVCIYIYRLFKCDIIYCSNVYRYIYIVQMWYKLILQKLKLLAWAERTKL